MIGRRAPSACILHVADASNGRAREDKLRSPYCRGVRRYFSVCLRGGCSGVPRWRTSQGCGTTRSVRGAWTVRAGRNPPTWRVLFGLRGEDGGGVPNKGRLQRKTTLFFRIVLTNRRVRDILSSVDGLHCLTRRTKRHGL